jgi:integrase
MRLDREDYALPPRRLGVEARGALATAARPKRASGAGSRRTSCATPRAVELAREGVPLNVIQRQLGHANLGTTSIYCKASTPKRSSRPCTPGVHR